MAAVQAVTAKASFCQRLIVGALPYRSSSDLPSIVSSARTRQQETPGEIIQARLRSSTGSHPTQSRLLDARPRPDDEHLGKRQHPPVRGADVRQVAAPTPNGGLGLYPLERSGETLPSGRRRRRAPVDHRSLYLPAEVASV